MTITTRAATDRHLTAVPDFTEDMQGLRQGLDKVTRLVIREAIGALLDEQILGAAAHGAGTRTPQPRRARADPCRPAHRDPHRARSVMTPADFARLAFQPASDIAESWQRVAPDVDNELADDDEDDGDRLHVCRPKLRAGMRAMIVMRPVRDLQGTAAGAARTYTPQRHLKGPGTYVYTADHVLTWAPDLADDVAASRLRLGIPALGAYRRQRAEARSRDPLTPGERAWVQAEAASLRGPAERAAYLAATDPEWMAVLSRNN